MEQLNCPRGSSTGKPILFQISMNLERKITQSIGRREVGLELKLLQIPSLGLEVYGKT